MKINSSIINYVDKNFTYTFQSINTFEKWVYVWKYNIL